MVRNKLKLKHHYTCLPDFGSGTPTSTLLDVYLIHSKKAHYKFIEYFTTYRNYKSLVIDKQPRFDLNPPQLQDKLSRGGFIVLLFLTDEGELWGVIKRWSSPREINYRNEIGEEFEIIITEE